MIEDLYSKPVLLLRSVSGKVFLFCTTYSLKVSGTFYSKAFARKVLDPRLLPFSKLLLLTSFRQGLTFGGRLYIVNLVITNKAPFAATALRLAFMRL